MNITIIIMAVAMLITVSVVYHQQQVRARPQMVDLSTNQTLAPSDVLLKLIPTENHVIIGCGSSFSDIVQNVKAYGKSANIKISDKLIDFMAKRAESLCNQ
jgi:hypothetical protein